MAGDDARAGARAWRIAAALCATAAVAVGVATWAILDGRPRAGGVATWAILDGRPRAGGVAALVAGGVLVGAGLVASRSRDPRAHMLVSFTDRAFDGCILASIAWVERSAEPAAAAGALMALAAGFLAAYVRARGSALGYLVEESAGTRAVRVGLISVALLAGWTHWALFGVASWMLLVALLRVSQVAKEERA